MKILEKLSPRNRRMVLIGAAAVAIFVLLKFGAFPLYDHETDVREKVRMQEITYRKYLKFIDRRKEIERRVRALKRRERSLNRKLLSGETASLAAADIQKTLEKISQSNQVTLKSVKVLDPRKEGGFAVHSVQVRLITDVTRMRKFIYDVENTYKSLVIPELRISVKSTKDPKEIVVTMTVSGFTRERVEAEERAEA